MPSKIVHKIPADLQKALNSNSRALKAWEDITPLARNEFICWILDAKMEETRERRIRRTKEELMEGKRRPCCWMGCTHRTDKAVSPSVQSVLDRRSKGIRKRKI